MNDMNFFAPFLATMKKSHKGMVPKIFLLLLVVVMVVAPIAGFGYELYIKSEISKIQAVLDVPANKAIIDKLDAMQTRLNVINQSIPELKKKDQALKSTEVITENSIQVIINALPKQVVFTSLNMKSSDISVMGTATDKPAIAEMEYNLRQTGLTENLLISDITKNDGGLFDFSINFKLKDVKAK